MSQLMHAFLKTLSWQTCPSEPSSPSKKAICVGPEGIVSVASLFRGLPRGLGAGLSASSSLDSGSRRDGGRPLRAIFGLCFCGRALQGISSASISSTSRSPNKLSAFFPLSPSGTPRGSDVSGLDFGLPLFLPDTAGELVLVSWPSLRESQADFLLTGVAVAG